MLDLDRPIRADVPDLRLSDGNAMGGVTLRHLLTHTGGWILSIDPPWTGGRAEFLRRADGRIAWLR